MVPAPIELKRGMGSSTTDRKICSTYRGGACSRSRSAAAAAALNDHRNLAAFDTFAAVSRARRIGKNKAAVDQPPLLKLFYKESDSNGRLRVSDWIVQGLYDYAVKETVELRLLAVFQHVADPTRVCTVADKNSTVAPLDLRPTFANQVFKDNSIEVRGQFNCTMNMPSTRRATFAWTQ